MFGLGTPFISDFFAYNIIYVYNIVSITCLKIIMEMVFLQHEKNSWERSGIILDWCTSLSCLVA